MRRLYTVGGLLAVVGVTVAVPAVCVQMAANPPAVRAADEKAVERPKWEYASLVTFSNTQEGETTETKLWRTRAGEDEAKTVKELAKKMKIEGKADTVIALINALADEGWELVTHTFDRALLPRFESVEQVWTFRRIKK